MDNYSGPPYDPEQIQRLQSEMEAAVSVEYGEFPERRTTFDTPPATPILTWQGQVVAAKGSLVQICGQSKSGKTIFLIGIAKAVLAGGGPVLDMDELVVNVPANNSVAWFDTEMEIDLFDKNMRFICGGTKSPDSLHAYHLRSCGILEMKEMVLKTIREIRPAVVFIDGLAELIAGGVNDSAESTEVIRDLMKLTDELGICFFLVVHDNEGNAPAQQKKSRGHAGSELTRKCTSSIVCEKKEAESAIVATVRQNRRGSIPSPICIRFDSRNRPYGDGVWEETGKPSTAKKKESTRETLIDMYGGKELAYTELVTKIMEIEGHGKRTAQSRVKDMGFLKTAAGTYLIPSG